MQRSGEMKPKRVMWVWGTASGIVLLLAPGCACLMSAQAPQVQQSPADQTGSSSAGPIAIVNLNGPDASVNPTVNGALEISDGKAMIMTSGSITARDRTTTVVLPHRGTLRVCATTTVKLAADSSQSAGGDAPGLLMALDHGALETSYATGQSADIILTPHFRILIGGPGASELKVRLGDDGDTCVDNSGPNAPYVVVTSLFEDGLYRVQPGQRVMFQHGSLRQVVDNEPEPCGCPPPPTNAAGNEFPLAQSEGLAPTPAIAPPVVNPNASTAPEAPPLVHNSNPAAAQTPPMPPENPAQASQAALATPTPAPKKKKTGFFARLANFFKKIFGAE